MRAWLVSAIVMTGLAGIAAAANAADLKPDAATTATAGGSETADAAGQAARMDLGPGRDEAAAPATDGPWAAFREFLFDFDRANIQDADRKKVAEIAAYMAANPATRLGIDGSMDPNGNGLRNRTLSERRIAAVRDALIRAGVPAERIHLGEYADPLLRRDRQVAVVLAP